MKRPLLIILGIIIVLILIGIWVYVLLTGTPNNGNQFAEFGFGDTSDPTFQGLPEPEPEPTVDVGPGSALKQLTTKPVAGFTEVQLATTTPAKAYYVEAGTGHIFTIDLETGEETRVSATTIPLTRAAAITPNGAHVMMQAGEGLSAEYIIGTLATSSDELSNFALSESVLSFAASDDNEFLYAVPDGNTTLAKAYNPRTNSSRVLFSVPFRDVTIEWGNTSSGPHLAFPKPASRLEGFVYSYTNGSPTRLPISGFGVSAVGSGNAVISSYMQTTGSYTSSGYSYTVSDDLRLPITVVPEKCTFPANLESQAICATSFTNYSNMMPDVWYRGEVTLTDELWEIDPATQTARPIKNISSVAGQSLDVVNPKTNPDGNRFYFQNKVDNTLWLYDFNI